MAKWNVFLSFTLTCLILEPYLIDIYLFLYYYREIFNSSFIDMVNMVPLCKNSYLFVRQSSFVGEENV